MIIEDLNLSCRAYNALKSAGIDTVEDAWLHIERAANEGWGHGKEFMMFKNLGRVSNTEIMGALWDSGAPKLESVFLAVSAVATLES